MLSTLQPIQQIIEFDQALAGHVFKDLTKCANP